MNCAYQPPPWDCASVPGCNATNYSLPDGTSSTFQCDSPTAYISPLALCASTYENSCSWWGQGIDPSDGPPPWHDAAADASATAGGSCVTDPNFLPYVIQSVGEAKVQVEKMRTRFEFLKNLLQDAVNISYSPDDLRFANFDQAGLVTTPSILVAGNPNPTPIGGVLAEAVNKLTKFLDNGTPFYPEQVAGPCDIPHPCLDNTKLFHAVTNPRIQDSPVERLIDARMRIAKDTSTSHLPAVAVYAWRDDPKPGQPLQGRWHVVKVEVRMPRRCNDACGAVEPDWQPVWPSWPYGPNGASIPDPLWPRVRTFTQTMGLRRCYELVDTTGIVKARVTRYDEDKSWNPLKFADGTPIWKIRFSHPASKSVPATELLQPVLSGPDDGSNCLDQAESSFVNTINCDPSRTPNCLYPWGDAFMLNKRPNYAAPDGSAAAKYANCWDTVHKKLENGVVSESCAMYYFSDGMKIKFVECDRSFKDGLN